MEDMTGIEYGSRDIQMGARVIRSTHGRGDNQRDKAGEMNVDWEERLVARGCRKEGKENKAKGEEQREGSWWVKGTTMCLKA